MVYSMFDGYLIFDGHSTFDGQCIIFESIWNHYNSESDY